MHSVCIHASPAKVNAGKAAKFDGKCVVEFRVLDGNDHDSPCPRCGKKTLTEGEELLLEAQLGV